MLQHFHDHMILKVARTFFFLGQPRLQMSTLTVASCSQNYNTKRVNGQINTISFNYDPQTHVKFEGFLLEWQYLFWYFPIRVLLICSLLQFFLQRDPGNKLGGALAPELFSCRGTGATLAGWLLPGNQHRFYWIRTPSIFPFAQQSVCLTSKSLFIARN